jgi:defect-in-organelle-trafficking protein DotD
MRNIGRVLSMTALAGLLVGMLGGCAAPVKLTPSGPDPVTSELNQAIAQQGQAAAFTRTADAKAPAAQLDKADGNITVSYRGEAADLMRRIAQAQGLAFRVEGPLPHLPLYVAVDTTNMRLVDLCREVGLQFGQRADLILTPRSIEIRYRGQQ